MKKTVAIVVFISLLTQCVIQLGMWGYYQINKAYIAQNLCENKNKPQMKCCGKCYLRKQLKKVDENSNSKKAPVKSEKSESLVFIISPVYTASLNYLYALPAIHNPARQHLFNHAILSRIFHPPSFAC